MKTIIKIFLAFAVLLFSFIPTLFASVYILTGFDRTAAIEFLSGVPVDRFWAVAIPLFITCYYGTFKAFQFFLNMGHPYHTAKVKVPEKRIFRLEDNDIAVQLQGIDISSDTIIADVSRLLNRYPEKTLYYSDGSCTDGQHPDLSNICNCDKRDMPVYKDNGKYWCPQCGYEVK